jgi:hypothetical protein
MDTRVAALHLALFEQPGKEAYLFSIPLIPQLRVAQNLRRPLGFWAFLVGQLRPTCSLRFSALVYHTRLYASQASGCRDG